MEANYECVCPPLVIANPILSPWTWKQTMSVYNCHFAYMTITGETWCECGGGGGGGGGGGAPPGGGGGVWGGGDFKTFP